MKYDVVSKMIDELNRRGTFGGFNQNQIRKILQGFWYEIKTDILRERGGRRRYDD